MGKVSIPFRADTGFELQVVQAKVPTDIMCFNPFQG